MSFWIDTIGILALLTAIALYAYVLGYCDGKVRKWDSIDDKRGRR